MLSLLLSSLLSLLLSSLLLRLEVIPSLLIHFKIDCASLDAGSLLTQQRRTQRVRDQMWSMCVILGTLLLFTLWRKLSLTHMHFNLSNPLLILCLFSLSFLSLVRLLARLHHLLFFLLDRLPRRERCSIPLVREERP